MTSSTLTYTPEDLAAGRAALIRGWSTGVEPEIMLTRAKDALVWDSDGRQYIDCTAQAWSNNIGAGDPRVVEAAFEQAREITHVRSNYDSVPLLLLARRLVDLAPAGLTKIAFCLHGSTAVESAMKLALKNTRNAGPFIALYDGYHGRTLASMSVSWPHVNDDFRPYMVNAVRVPNAYCYRCPLGKNHDSCAIDCADVLRSVIRQGTNGRPAAVIMEPIQGNGGQIDFPLEYYRAVRQICDEEGVLLIWDEIQTAFGRMGKMFASEYYGVVPDIVVFGKALGGGFPLAGILARDGLSGFDPGDDALTFGQWPVSMAAALAMLAVLEEDDLLSKCREMGEYTTACLQEMQKRHPLIGDIRGPGLMIGIELVRDRTTKEPAVSETTQVYKRGFERGVIFGTSRYGGIGNVVKIKPSLTITRGQMDTVLEVLDRILTELEAEAGTSVSG
jgi:4-aminobutyrate aminotransferase / (S)-3-amino-2-methylpropionate transaminase / 5-aminovalerate transaminase